MKDGEEVVGQAGGSGVEERGGGGGGGEGGGVEGVAAGSGGGGMSLPYRNAAAEGWARRRRSWVAAEAAYTARVASVQAGQFCHASQQHHPGTTSRPSASASAKKL